MVQKQQTAEGNSQSMAETVEKARGWGGGGGTSYNGLYGEAPPESGTFSRLQVYERVGILLVEVYERVGKSAIWLCKMVQRANSRYVEEVPFVNRRYTEGVPFS